MEEQFLAQTRLSDSPLCISSAGPRRPLAASTLFEQVGAGCGTEGAAKLIVLRFLLLDLPLCGARLLSAPQVRYGLQHRPSQMLSHFEVNRFMHQEVIWNFANNFLGQFVVGVVALRSTLLAMLSLRSGP